jgi:hypothetical protein
MRLRRKRMRRSPAVMLDRNGLCALVRRFWNDETATAQSHALMTGLAIVALMTIASCL